MKNQPHSIAIRPDGTIVLIYTDDLESLASAGRAVIARASHVEPAPGGWTADMSPSGGPILGPFRLRQQALDAEVEWIGRHVIGTN
mgnify:CR=1 FL=1